MQNPRKEYNPLVDMTPKERAELRTMPRVDREVFVSLARAYRRAGFMLQFQAFKQGAHRGPDGMKLCKLPKKLRVNDDMAHELRKQRREARRRAQSRPASSKALTADAIASILGDAQELLGIRREMHSVDIGAGLSGHTEGQRAAGGGTCPPQKSRRRLYTGSLAGRSHLAVMDSLGLSPITGHAPDAAQGDMSSLRSIRGGSTRMLINPGGLGQLGGSTQLQRSASLRFGPQRRAADILADGLLGGMDSTDILVELMKFETESLLTKVQPYSGKPGLSIPRSQAVDCVAGYDFHRQLFPAPLRSPLPAPSTGHSEKVSLCMKTEAGGSEGSAGRTEVHVVPLREKPSRLTANVSLSDPCAHACAAAGIQAAHGRGTKPDRGR